MLAVWLYLSVYLSPFLSSLCLSFSLCLFSLSCSSASVQRQNWYRETSLSVTFSPKASFRILTTEQCPERRKWKIYNLENIFDFATQYRHLSIINIILFDFLCQYVFFMNLFFLIIFLSDLQNGKLTWHISHLKIWCTNQLYVYICVQ